MNAKPLLWFRLFMVLAVTPMVVMAIYLEFGSSRWVDFNHDRATCGAAIACTGLIWIIKPWRGDKP